MSAYFAPSGAVYERGTDGMDWARNSMFVVLDGYYKTEDGRKWRWAYDLTYGELTGFGQGSGWDENSMRVA